MRSRAVACSFCGVTLVRLSPDSARIKNTTANMVASQKVTRTAFDFFIFFNSFFARQRFGLSFRTETEPHLTLRDSAFGATLRRSFKERQAESFGRNATEPADLRKRKVTELLPARCADAFPAFKTRNIPPRE